MGKIIGFFKGVIIIFFGGIILFFVIGWAGYYFLHEKNVDTPATEVSDQNDSNASIFSKGKYSWKIVERGSGSGNGDSDDNYSTWGWHCAVTNNDSVNHKISVEFKLLDKDGIELDSDVVMKDIKAGETASVSNDAYIKNNLVGQVRSSQVEIGRLD